MHSAQNCILTDFFKDLAKANGQPGKKSLKYFLPCLSTSLNPGMCFPAIIPACLPTIVLLLTDNCHSDGQDTNRSDLVRPSLVEEKCTGRQERRRISISTISKELMPFSELCLSLLSKQAFHSASFTCKPCNPQPLAGCLPLHQSPRYHTAPAVCVVFGIHTAWWQPVGRESNVFYLFRVKHSLKSTLNK